MHVEMTDGGLVTSRDPSLLKEGELQKCDNGIYRPDSIAVHPIGFRLKQGNQMIDSETGAPQVVSGIRRLTFDNFHTITLLMDGQGKRWRYGPDSETGNWEILDDVGERTAETRIEAIHQNGQYLLANGEDDQRVLSVTTEGSSAGELSTIKHGMTPLAGTDTSGTEVSGTSNCKYSLELKTDAESPPLWQLLGEASQILYYWITEYDAVNDIESAVTPVAEDGTLLVQYITEVFGPSDYIVKINIEYGTAPYTQKVNPNATHWRIYRGINFSRVEDIGNIGAELAVQYSPFPVGSRVPAYSSADPLVTEVVSQVEIPDQPGGPDTVSVYDYGVFSALPYPVIELTQYGVTTAVDRDTPPPHKFSTGDVFGDSVVTNDVGDKSLIRYAAPDRFHSWPSLYTVNFDDRRSDEITCIRALGRVCVVGLRRQIYRVNYLPLAGDTVNRGLLKEPIADHGIVGPDAATVFSLPGGIPRLAYISETGPYSTDGMTHRPLTRDLDWGKTVNVGSLSNAILLNVNRLQSLVLFYVPPGVGSTEPTTRTRALFFSYAPEHLKYTNQGPQLKVSGPVSIGAASADYDPDDRSLWTGGYAGQVRTEDHVPGVNLTDDETQLAETISSCGLVVQTRIVHLAGLDGETEMEKLWLLTESPLIRRGVESVSVMTRDRDQDIEIDTFGETYDTDKLTYVHKKATSGGIGAQVKGFAPLVMVGIESFQRKGT